MCQVVPTHLWFFSCLRLPGQPAGLRCECRCFRFVHSFRWPIDANLGGWKCRNSWAANLIVDDNKFGQEAVEYKLGSNSGSAQLPRKETMVVPSMHVVNKVKHQHTQI